MWPISLRSRPAGKRMRLSRRRRSALCGGGGDVHRYNWTRPLETPLQSAMALAATPYSPSPPSGYTFLVLGGGRQGGRWPPPCPHPGGAPSSTAASGVIAPLPARRRSRRRPPRPPQACRGGCAPAGYARRGAGAFPAFSFPPPPPRPPPTPSPRASHAARRWGDGGGSGRTTLGGPEVGVVARNCPGLRRQRRQRRWRRRLRGEAERRKVSAARRGLYTAGTGRRGRSPAPTAGTDGGRRRDDSEFFLRRIGQTKWGGGHAERLVDEAARTLTGPPGLDRWGILPRVSIPPNGMWTVGMTLWLVPRPATAGARAAAASMSPSITAQALAADRSHNKDAADVTWAPRPLFRRLEVVTRRTPPATPPPPEGSVR